MTGYSKIKRKKLPKYGNGVDNPGGATADANGDDNSGGISSAGVSTGLNFLGSTLDSFNKGGTGGGSVALGTLSSGLKGAAIGTSILPGVGTAIGGGIGLVSGFIGAEGKRNALLKQQGIQRTATANNAMNQSNQTLRSYDNQGVEDAQLYAVGGTPPPTDSLNYTKTNNPDVYMGKNGVPINRSDYNALKGSALNFHSFESYADWAAFQVPQKPINGSSAPQQPVTTNTMPLSDKARGLSNSYYPASQTNQGTSIPTQQPSANYGTSYAKGGQIHIKPSHKGRFTAYLKRTGKTAAQAANSSDPHVRAMADFAINIGHTKKAFGGRLYDDGGGIDPIDQTVNPEWEAEGGETVQGDANVEQSTPVASDMQQITGPSHEQGGVMGSGGDRIYSDRLQISPDLQNILRTNGIKVGNKQTYADVSAKIGKLKGKFENKTDGIGKQTANIMLPRLEQSLDDTFNDQEAGKAAQAYKKFAKGGLTGGIRSNLDGMSMVNTFPDGGSPDGSIIADPRSIGMSNADVTGITNIMNRPDPNSIPAVPDSYWNPAQPDDNPSFLDKASDFIGDNSGQLTNAGVYLSNLGTINRMNTTVNPQYLSSPNYNYVDRSGSAINRNSALLRTGIAGLTNSGRTVNASNIGALYAKTVEGNSQIAANENARKDNYNDVYNQRYDRINAENTGINNKAQDDARELFNSQLALKQGARNAFVAGIQGNIASKKQGELDQQRIKLIGQANDSNGVMTRYKAKLKAAALSGDKDSQDLYNRIYPND